MDFEIAIPSKGRAGLITSQKIFKSATLYIPESELMQYSVYKNKIVTIPIEVKGITATRNWILEFNKGKNVFFLDDDFQYGGYIERTDLKYKVKRITEESIYIDEIIKLFDIAEQSNSKIFGFFTVGNNLTNYAYSPFLFNGVCLGSCMGMINDGTYYFDETFEVKEDYELTLRHLTERGITVRSNILFMQHEHTQTKGGCRDSKRIDKEKSAIKRLIKMYPGMIKEAKHRGTSFSIQLNL
jgi:glycosyltransferase involved in cell wall biosynthesis